jgi:hypothetical protein
MGMNMLQGRGHGQGMDINYYWTGEDSRQFYFQKPLRKNLRKSAKVLKLAEVNESWQKCIKKLAEVS